MGRLVTFRISASKSFAGSAATKVSTTATPLLPMMNPALLPAWPPSGLMAAYTPSPIFFTVKSAALQAKVRKTIKSKIRGVLFFMPLMVARTAENSSRKTLPLMTLITLLKTSDGYVLRNGDAAAEPAPAVSRVVREFVREVRRAQNLLIIKTIPGSAQPVGVAIDGEEWDHVVGTIAGDDTILVIAANNKSAKQLQSHLEDMRA